MPKFSMTYLRYRARYIMLVTLILIIPAFIMVYGYQGCDTGGQRSAGWTPWAADVNGQRINTFAFQQELRRRSDMLHRQLGENWRLQVGLDYEEQVLDAMIHQALVEQFANRHKIRTTDREVAGEIASIPWLQGADERFDGQLYRNYLLNTRQSEAQFMSQVAREMTQQKVYAAVTGGLNVTQTEAREEFLRRMQNTVAEILSFDAVTYGQEIEIDEGELEAFFEEHKDAYYLEDRVAVHYVVMEPQALAPQLRYDDPEIEDFFIQNRTQFAFQPTARVSMLTISPDNFLHEAVVTATDVQEYFDRNDENYTTELSGRLRVVSLPLDAQALGITVDATTTRRHYDRNPSEFDLPEAARVRHILFGFDGGTPSASVKEETLAQAQAARADILGGTISFAEAALRYSDDPGSRENGGEYDFTERGVWVAPFEEAAFNTPLNVLTEPIETQFGYHLIEVLDRREGGMQSYEEAEPALRERLLDEEIRTTAREHLESLRDRGVDLASADLDPMFEVSETGLVHRDSAYVPGVDATDAGFVVSSVLRLEAGELTQVLVGQNRFYLVQLLEKQEPRPMLFSEAREPAEQDLRREMATLTARGQAQTAYDRIANQGESPEMVAESLGLEVVDSGLFAGRQDPNNPLRPAANVPGVSQPAQQAFKDTVFATAVGGVGGPIEDEENGFHVFVVLERNEEQIPELDEVRDVVRDALARQVGVDRVRNVAEDLVYEAEVAGDLAQGTEMLNEARGLELSMATSLYFTKDEPPAELRQRSEVALAAFQLTHEDPLYHTPIAIMGQTWTQQGQQMAVQAYYIIELASRSEAHQPTLDEVRLKVMEDYRRFRGGQVAQATAREALDQLRAQVASGALSPPDATRTVDLAAFARDNDYDFMEQARFSRGGFVPNLGMAPSVARTGFDLEVGQVSDVIEFEEEVRKDMTLPKGYYIIQVVDREEPDDEAFEQQRDSIREQLTQERRNAAWVSWQRQMREQATVQIDERSAFPERFEDEEDDAWM